MVNSERITENNSNGNQATAGEIAALIEEIAPVSIQMSFDNSGFLVGSRESKVDRVMLALEVSDEVIKDAIKQECQMIITHHPLIFHAEKSVTADTYQGKLLLRLISSGIALYSSHTPLDAAPAAAMMCFAICLVLRMSAELYRLAAAESGNIFVQEWAVLMQRCRSLRLLHVKDLAQIGYRLLTAAKEYADWRYAAAQAAVFSMSALRRGLMRCLPASFRIMRRWRCVKPVFRQ